jgi:hypothetical protein
VKPSPSVVTFELTPAAYVFGPAGSPNDKYTDETSAEVSVRAYTRTSSRPVSADAVVVDPIVRLDRRPVACVVALLLVCNVPLI